MPKVSLVVPVYNMDNSLDFLKRNLESILKQTFTDYEIIVSDDSNDDLIETWLSRYKVKYFKNTGDKGMANNTNNAITNATGDLVKILFQDDFFFTENSLKQIVDHFTDRTEWLVTSCLHSMDGKTFFNEHKPYYSQSDNTIGSPSVTTFRRSIDELFDTNFHWVMDLDWYKRLYYKYGKPKIYDKPNVVIGIHPGQKTHLLTDERKILEHKLLKIKHETYEKSLLR